MSYESTEVRCPKCRLSYRVTPLKKLPKPHDRIVVSIEHHGEHEHSIGYKSYKEPKP